MPCPVNRGLIQCHLAVLPPCHVALHHPISIHQASVKETFLPCLLATLTLSQEIVNMSSPQGGGY